MHLNRYIEPYKPLLNCLRYSTIHFINEQTGVPDCLHYITDTLITYVQSYINKTYYNKKKDNKHFQIQIPNDIFDEQKVFFTNCSIWFIMDLYNNSFPLKRSDMLLSSYADEKSVLKNIDDKPFLTNGQFIIRISELETEWVEAAKIIIYHEFTHAFQDYNLLINNANYKNEEPYVNKKFAYHNSLNTLFDILNNQEHYNNIREYKDLIVDCCNAVYVIDKMEQGAFIAQSYTEMKNYIKSKRYRFSYEETIACTKAYENIQHLKELVNDIKDANVEKQIVVGYTIRKLYDGVESTSDNINEVINAYNSFLLKIQRVINNLYSKLCKVLGTICSENSLVGIHGKLNKLNKRIK